MGLRQVFSRLPLAWMLTLMACAQDVALQDPGDAGTFSSSAFFAPPTPGGYRVQPAPSRPELTTDGPTASGCSGGCPADSTVIDFEVFTDPSQYHQVTTHYDSLGVLFDSTVVGVVPGYYWQNYPPRSGNAVATADFTGPSGGSGIFSFTLLADAFRVRIYVTSLNSVTLRCFNAASVEVGLAVFAGGNTVETNGGTPNQPMEVSALGIRHCTFEGSDNQYGVDDLTLVWREPLPTLACDTVVRGTTGTCTVTGADSVLHWRFEGQLEFNPDSAGPSVTRTDTTGSSTWGPGPDSVWSGLGVLGGTVSATVRVDTTEVVLATPWEVVARSSAGWVWGPSQWHIDQDTVAICPYVDYVLPFKNTAPAHKGVVGYNRRRADCTSVGSIEPNIRDTLSDGSPAAAGVTLDSVPHGPNKQIFFVTSTSFTMNRATEMDPWFRTGGPSIPVLDSVDYAACWNAMGLGGTPPISVNLYTYNQICRGFDPLPWIAGILNHEGYGTQNPLDPATANGHEARRRLAALDPANDPRTLVEPLVHPFSAHGLRGYVYQSVFDADLRISQFASDATGLVKDNYVNNPVAGDCGYLWVLFRPDSNHANKWYRFLEMQYFQADTTLPKKCP